MERQDGADAEEPAGAETSGLIDQRRSNSIRLRTLVTLRWIAISGQAAAIVAGRTFFDLDIDLRLCALVIAATVAANLFAVAVYPESRRLSEAEIASMLLFDILQLAGLLYLTGGLTNPFALLLMGPVTIGTTALRLRATALLGAVAIAMASILAVWHQPLVTTTGEVMTVPWSFVLGFWIAIVIGTVFLGVFAQRMSTEVHAMSDALAATQMALAREQALTDLGGVVAAAAHELGTPLATIKLTSAELMDELKDRPELHDDAALIREQATRCSGILRSMGRAGKEDMLTQRAPLGEIVRLAAEPHRNRGRSVEITTMPGPDANPRQPIVFRRAEIIHGLRNLIQNAVDFAGSAVWIDVGWTADRISVRISDDGPGFPPNVLARIGDPYMSRQRAGGGRRGYEGMGLGLFIAKTLLERAGAEIIFANGHDAAATRPRPGTRSGAIVEVSWPRAALSPDAASDYSRMGDNPPIEA